VKSIELAIIQSVQELPWLFAVASAGAVAFWGFLEGNILVGVLFTAILLVIVAAELLWQYHHPDPHERAILEGKRKNNRRR
jgi:hypothetical protein